MKVFISFRFTGEDPEELDKTLSQICNRIKEQGHECFCTFWDEEMFQRKKYNYRQIMDHGLKGLNESDIVLCLITSNNKSEGMLIEIGYALAKGKRIILAIKKGVQLRFTESIAEKIIRFENIDNLISKLDII